MIGAAPVEHPPLEAHPKENMLRILIISTFAFMIVVGLSSVHRRPRHRATWFDVTMAAAVSAWAAVVALSGIEYLMPGAMAVVLLALAN